MPENGIKYICDLCGSLIEIGRPRFILQGRLYCAYDGGHFDESVLQPGQSLQEEMEKIFKIVEKKSAKELNDEVHYSFSLDLCRSCRDRIYEILEKKKPLPDADPAE